MCVGGGRMGGSDVCVCVCVCEGAGWEGVMCEEVGWEGVMCEGIGWEAVGEMCGCCVCAYVLRVHMYAQS